MSERREADGREREFFIYNLLVRIHFIIVMIRWTGLAPWQLAFPFPGSLTSTFLDAWRRWRGRRAPRSTRPEFMLIYNTGVCDLTRGFAILASKKLYQSTEPTPKIAKRVLN